MAAKDATFEEVTMDMTPMIDVVFLLIIFFMVVNEITKMQIHAGIILPLASEARIDDRPPPGRLVLNVDKDGDVYSANKKWDDAALVRLLQIEASVSKDPVDGFSNRAILLRADARVKYSKIAQIMYKCQMQKIWKLSFGTKPVDPSAGPEIL